MRWILSMSLFAGAVAAVLASAAAPAEASDNVGWLYTVNGGGAIFFDADLNGQPGVEKITVCDNKSDGRGVMGEVEVWGGGDSAVVGDPSNDGKCNSITGDFFKEETLVVVRVWEYAGSWTSVVVSATGVA